MLDLNLTQKSRASWEGAALGSLVLEISRNCRRDDEFRLTYLASDLRPTLSDSNQERLRRLRLAGWGDWEPFSTASPEVRSVSTPPMRRQRIVGELGRLSEKFGWLKPLEQVSEASPGHMRFGALSPPRGVLGGGATSTPGTRAFSVLTRSGPFSLGGGGRQPRLRGILLGRPTGQELRRAGELLGQVRRELSQMGVRWAPGPGDEQVVQWNDLGSPESLSGALDAAGLEQHDAVVLFGAKSLGQAETAVYERMKLACLLRGPADSTRHLASQWIQNPASGTWGTDSRTQWSLMNVNLGMLAKLGAVPFGIDISGWRTAQSPPAGRDIMVAGYDVCHMASKTVHVAVGTRVAAEVGSGSVMSRIETHVQKIEGETVPAETLRRIVPLEDARGKVVIIHRDGRLPNDELASWQAYYDEELKATGVSLLLLEVVKLVGGTPRMYDALPGGGLQNVEEGRYVQWSPRDVYLVSSKVRAEGTASPLQLRLRETLGRAPELSTLAWVRSIFDLSFMHHGSVFSAPKLPVTTYFSDRLAYMVAKGDIDWDAEIEQRMASLQQPWL